MGVVGWDQAVTMWINQHHSMLLDAIMVPVAWLGEGGAAWLTLTVIMLIAGDRRARFTAALFMAGLLVCEFVLVPAARGWWPRPRPYTYMLDVRQLGVPWATGSFPSGHMYLWMSATMIFGAVYPRWRRALVILTVLTAYSRPYAGMHHILDVAGGAAVGVAVGALEVLAAARLGLMPRAPVSHEAEARSAPAEAAVRPAPAPEPASPDD